MIAALSGRVSLVAVPANVLAEPAVPVATVFGFGAARRCPVLVGRRPRAGMGRRLAVSMAGRRRRPARQRARRAAAVVRRAARRDDIARRDARAGRAGGPRRYRAAAARRSAGCRARADPGAVGGVGMAAARAGSSSPATSVRATRWCSPPARTIGVEIDAGPDPVLVDRCLRDLDITEIALLAFTHFHLDHVGGLAGVLHGRRVGRVITGPLAEPASGVAARRRPTRRRTHLDDLYARGRHALRHRPGAAGGAGAGRRVPRHPIRPEQLLAGACARSSAGCRSC